MLGRSLILLGWVIVATSLSSCGGESDDSRPESSDARNSEPSSAESNETKGKGAFETPVGSPHSHPPKPAEETDKDDGSGSSGKAPGETNGSGAYETPVSTTPIEVIAGPGASPSPPSERGPLTPEELHALGLDAGANNQAPITPSPDDERPPNGASEPGGQYLSCEECRQSLCTESWSVCEDEPRCTSALGCLGGECGASDSVDCVSVCFGGDTKLAVAAFQLYACTSVQCSVECAR